MGGTRSRAADTDPGIWGAFILYDGFSRATNTVCRKTGVKQETCYLSEHIHKYKKEGPQ